MKSKLLLPLFLFTLIISCTKNKNSEPTFPVNSHRIKEILTQRNGKSMYVESFEYKEEKLITKKVKSLENISDMDYTETFTYDQNVVTSISEGYVKSKLVTEFDGKKLKSITSYWFIDNAFKKSYLSNFTYDGESIKSYSFTEFYNDSTRTMKVDVIFSNNKVIELLGGKLELNDQSFNSKISFVYEDELNVSQIQKIEVEGVWEDIYKWDYVYKDNKVVEVIWYDFKNSEWIITDRTTYEYNANGYLYKEINHYYTKIYTYEDGNGNASQVDNKYFFLEDLDATPYYKSGHFGQSPQSNKSHQIVQQILRQLVK